MIVVFVIHCLEFGHQIMSFNKKHIEENDEFCWQVYKCGFLTCQWCFTGNTLYTQSILSIKENASSGGTPLETPRV